MPERVMFKGKTASELEGISMQDFTKMIKSRARRYLKKNSLQYRKLNEKIEAYRKRGLDKPIKTQTREAVILPSWINAKFEVYNGKEFVQLVIAPNMIGRRLGEFVYTTKRVQHSAPGIRATRGSKFLAQK